MNIHPIARTVKERAAVRGDRAMASWSEHALAGLLRESTLIPAKGFTRREAKLLEGVKHLPPEKMEQMGHQSMPAHILAAALPAGDLAMILGVDHATRLLALCGITLHDAGKVEIELATTTTRSDIDGIKKHLLGLEELAGRWGMEPLLQELEQELRVDRQQLLSMLSWITSEAEEVRGHNAPPVDHGMDDAVWRKHADDLRLCSILARLGDLVASLGNIGKDARALAREQRISMLIDDACSSMGRPKLKMAPWTLKRERTMTTMMLQDAAQRCIQLTGGHVWLISRMGGIALLDKQGRMPSRDELNRSFKEVISSYIADRTPTNPSLSMAGILPHEKKASAFLLSVSAPGDMPSKLLAAAKKSFNRKDSRAFSMKVAIAIATSCRQLLEREGIASGNEALAAMLRAAPASRFPYASEMADDLLANGMGKTKEEKPMLHDRREMPLSPADGDTPLADAMAAGAGFLLKNAPDRSSEQLIAQAIEEVLSEDITLPGEAADQLASLQEPTSKNHCWRCGEARPTIAAKDATGTMQMSGYNARQGPGFTNIKAGACRSCLLEELLIKAEDPNRDEQRGDIYVHLMLDGFTSPLTADGLADAAEQLRRRQSWKLTEQEWTEPSSEAERKEEQAEEQEENIEELLAEQDLPEHDDDDDDEDEQEEGAKSEIPEVDKSLFFKRIIGTGQRNVLGQTQSNPPVTHFAVRFNADGTTETEAIALAAALSMQLAGMRVIVSGEIQPPQGTRDAHAMSIEIPAPIWTLWGAGERRFGLKELPLVLDNIVSLERLARLRAQGGNIDANALRGVAQLVNHEPLRAISGRFVSSKEDKNEGARAQSAIEALEQHLAYLNQVQDQQGGQMSHIRKAEEALDKMKWDNRYGDSTHSRTKPLKEALDSMSSNCRTGQTWEERQDARDIATGRVHRMLDKSDPRDTAAFIEAVDRELLQGICAGSVEKLRQRTNEIVQAIDAIKLSIKRNKSDAKKAAELKEKQEAADTQHDQEVNA